LFTTFTYDGNEGSSQLVKSVSVEDTSSMRLLPSTDFPSEVNGELL